MTCTMMQISTAQNLQAHLLNGSFLPLCTLVLQNFQNIIYTVLSPSLLVSGADIHCLLGLFLFADNLYALAEINSYVMGNHEHEE